MPDDKATPVSSDSDTARAVWTTADQNDLDDDCFAYVAPGGHKDASGKTTPRSLRHLPYKDKNGQIDEAHVRNALARLPETDIPAAAKAAALKKLVAAAKKVGIDVSTDVSGEESGRSQDTPTVQRGVGGDDLVEHVFTAPITRVDPEKRLVTVTGTSEAKDSFRTRFDYEASKDAFTRWIGNVREMHQPKAVGSRVAVHCDDDNRRIEATIRISKGAQDTWEKILDGTLKGASIGASNVVWEHKRDGESNDIVPVARKYDLVELSLVDNPSNPDCLGIAVMRNAVPDEFLLDEMVDAAPLTETRAGATGGAKPSAAALSASRPDAHDPLAHPTDSAVDRPVTETPVAGAQADGEDADEFDPMLREVDLDGAGAVAPMGNSAGEVDEQLHEMDGPPDDPSAATFAASRPQGVLGSQVASRSLSDRVAAFAQQGGSESIPPVATPDFAAVDRMRAPFGAGATLSSAVAQLPSKRQMRDAKKSALAHAEEEVRAAGDAAEAMVAPWNAASGEDYTAYILRSKRARGAAERAIIERQQLARIQSMQESQPERVAAQATRSTAWAAPRSQAATATAQRMASANVAPVAEPVASAAATVAAVAAVVTSEPVAPVVEERAFPVGAAGVPGASMAVAAPAAAQSGAPNAEPGNGRQLHLHSHAHDAGMLHSHEHPHTHSNGTTHSHPHGHDHFHEDNHASQSPRAADGASGGHGHEHTHDHAHSHTYRDGAPLDSALLLLLPDYARAGASSGNDRQPMKIGPEAPAASLSSLKPVSGSAQSAVNGKPRSPQMSVQPAAVGHMDMLNTEDENAVGFGVPEEVEPVATPEDGEVTAPVGFHEGGHSPAGGAGAPLNPKNSAYVDGASGRMATPTAAAAAPSETASAPSDARAATRKPAKGVDDGKASDATGSDAGKMDDDLDYDGDEDEEEDKAAGGRSAQDADETRVGARISAESRDALHAAREQMQGSIRALCAHCGCENCSATTDALDAAAAHADAFSAGPERMAQMTTALGEQRLLAGLIAQAVAAEVARAQDVTRRETVQDTTQALTALFAQTLEETLAPVLTRLADLELTLADAQRGARAETERAVTEQIQRLNAVPNAQLEGVRTETTTRLAALDQRLEAVAEDASGLKAAVDSMYGLVERIAQQPLDVVGPAQYAIDKRFALTDEGALHGQTTGGGGANGFTSVAQQIKSLQDLARQTSDPQLQMRYAQEVARLEAQSGGGNRRMLGQARAR